MDKHKCISFNNAGQSHNRIVTSEFQLSVDLHLEGVEILRDKKPANLRDKLQPSVFLGDFFGAWKQIDQGGFPVRLAQDLDMRGLEILVIVALDM